MSTAIQIELEVPGEVVKFRLPEGVDQRLQELLDRQDQGHLLSASEFLEAEGLVELSEFLTLLRLRAERAQGLSA